MTAVDSLRATHMSVDFEHRHSGLTLLIRGEVIEAEYMLLARSAQMVSVAALSSHPVCDMDKNQERVKALYYDVLASIPYMTGGKSGTEVVTDERMKFVEQYNEMRRKTMKAAVK